jgi:hypothetical protein
MPRPAGLAAEVSDNLSRLDPHGVALDFHGYGRQLTFVQ